MRYLVKTKNPQYKGTAVGVSFNKGQAIVEDLTIDPNLGRNVEEVATVMRELGYQVEPIQEDKTKK